MEKPVEAEWLNQHAASVRSPDGGIDAPPKRGDVTSMKWRAPIRTAIAGFRLVPAPLRKLIVAVIGGTILLIGLALIVLPGPAFIVIPVGLGVLATEFAWARRAVDRGRQAIAKARRRVVEKVSP